LGPLGGHLGPLGGHLGPSWRPLGANKPPISPPEPPQGSQKVPQDGTEPPQSPPKQHPTGCPQAFRAANWPRRDARSVYNKLAVVVNGNAMVAVVVAMQ
jgi:hypothetical protein